MDENIIRKDDSVINLKDICELYCGKNTNNHIKNKIKKEVEKWIKTKHKDISPNYQDSRMNNVKYRGWKGFCFLEVDDL
jgi:hypothetical protein